MKDERKSYEPNALGFVVLEHEVSGTFGFCIYLAWGLMMSLPAWGSHGMLIFK